MNAIPPGRSGPRSFVFLQGPISPFFREVGEGLRALGHQVARVNLNLGDRLLWWGRGAVDYRGRAEDWPGWIDRFLEERGATDLVLLGEQRPQHKPAIDAARRRGVQVVATDFGYIRPDWIVLERDGMNAESRFPRDPDTIIALGRALPPPDLVVHHRDCFRTQAIWDIAYHMAMLLPWPFPHYRTHQLYHPIPVYAGTAMRLLLRGRENRRAARILEGLKGVAGPKGPLFLFAMQMETDFSLRAYSPYPDMDSAITDVVASFAAHAPPEAQLLVKVHPLDPGLKMWHRRVRQIARRFGASERVHYLGGGNLGDITESVQGVVTVNSTVGLRAIIDGLPTHALGEAIYRIPGLVHPGGLDGFWRAAAPPEPLLRECFLRAIAHCLHIRGVFYARAGLDAAVRNAVHRLHHGLLNVPVEWGWQAVAEMAQRR
ncbi:capsular biosynthesis protein [Roseomonas sp. OT10]|uniref:capsule biosynthesis protein n=1 Tax=Roseomonas cutis TaxID=2897332 RepID=UPI001E352E8F|nr:capsular biosynthesis protein [Roseomonas sp. OT10]UFN50289.1 capsular biosynthesis protein [Roseomonas sp. OT10]